MRCNSSATTCFTSVLIVVLFDFRLHDIIAIPIAEIQNIGNFPVGFGFSGYDSIIYHNLGVENLLLNALFKIIRYLYRQTCPV